MEKLIESAVKKAYTETYTKLLRDFCNDEKICQIAKTYPFNGHNCVPAPFLPIIGSGYYEVPIRVAIYGMETLCWHDLSKFVQKFHNACSQGKDPLAAVKLYTDGNLNGDRNEKHKVQRFHVHHGVDYWKKRKNAFGFWTFAFSVLADIYNKTEKQVRGDQKILSSFIWGNVNAYEKYEATWKKLKVASDKTKEKKEDWRTVFELSKRFNSAQLLLPYARPQIMVVFYKEMSLNWLTKKNDEIPAAKVEVRKINWGQSKYVDILKENIQYYYLPESNTKVLQTLHPGRMRYYKGVGAKQWKAAIKHAIQSIMEENNISPSS